MGLSAALSARWRCIAGVIVLAGGVGKAIRALPSQQLGERAETTGVVGRVANVAVVGTSKGDSGAKEAGAVIEFCKNASGLGPHGMVL